MVWCLLRGRGVVSRIFEGNGIEVKFIDSNAYAVFTKCGREHIEFDRSLFFSEPVIHAETEPSENYDLIGKEIFFKQQGSAWLLGIVDDVSYDSIRVEHQHNMVALFRTGIATGDIQYKIVST